jgi:hypothetical protein
VVASPTPPASPTSVFTQYPTPPASPPAPASPAVGAVVVKSEQVAAPRTPAVASPPALAAPRTPEGIPLRFPDGIHCCWCGGQHDISETLKMHICISMLKTLENEYTSCILKSLENMNICFVLEATITFAFICLYIS